MLRLHPTVLRARVTTSGLSRRLFLRHTTLLLAGSSVLGLAACGDSGDDLLGPGDENDLPGDGDPGNGDDPDGQPNGDPGNGDEPDDEPNGDPGDEEPGDGEPEGVEVAMAPELRDVGGTQIVDDDAVLGQLDTDNNGRGNDEILLVRVDAETVAANTVVCTHQQCNVAFNAGAERLDCPCHGSRYDLGGKVVRGPAARPLKHFKATIHGDSVFLVDV